MSEPREVPLSEMLDTLSEAARQCRWLEEKLNVIAERLQRDEDTIMEQALKIDALMEERDGLRESLANQEWTLKQAELMLRAEGVDL